MNRILAPGVKNSHACPPVQFVNDATFPHCEDTTVPVKQGHSMVEALTKAGGNVTSVFYKDAGHGFSKSEDFDDWLRHLEAFLAKNNPS